MKPEQTPNYNFEREGKVITVWFSPHPLKSAEGKVQCLGFRRECSSETEAILLEDYLSQFRYERDKHLFTEGYNAKKRKEQNYYL